MYMARSTSETVRASSGAVALSAAQIRINRHNTKHIMSAREANISCCLCLFACATRQDLQ